MLTYQAMTLNQAWRYVPPMLRIMAQNDPDAAARMGATRSVLEGYRDRAFVVVAVDGWRLAGAAVWTCAANRIWPQDNRVALEDECGIPIAESGTLINLFVCQSHRGQGVGAELESRMFAQMQDLGCSHMLNFAYGTPGIQSFLSSRPGAGSLQTLQGRNGSPVILAPLAPRNGRLKGA